MAGPVLIMAGGTGGHIFPGLAVAAALRARGVDVVWMGSRRGLESKLVPAEGIQLDLIDIGGLRGKGVMALLSAPLVLFRAILQALSTLRKLHPRAAISFGGYAAGPGGVAAWLTRCPLLVHEQNSVAGFTNRLLSRVARRVLLGFPDALPSGQWLGNPVRAAIADLPLPAERFADRTGPLRLLVLGGSQGARALNAAVPAALKNLSAIEVRHQCGARMIDAARASYADVSIAASVEPFIQHMEEAYGWADLVICRSGALTIAELAAAGVASILVPFPSAVDDHQTHNARWLVAAGAAECIAESPTLADELSARLGEYLNDRAKLLHMAQAARSLAKIDAAERVADACLAEARI